VIFEADAAGRRGEQRIVLAESDVETGSEPPSPLAHEDGAPRDEVAVETLDTEALRLAVTSVP